MEGLDFRAGHGPAGILKDRDGPRQAGRYGYMPYRSVSHYVLCRTLAEDGPVRCSCETATEHVDFTVTAIPEYGVLEIEEIERTPLILP